MPCGPTADLLGELVVGWGELPVAQGLSGKGWLLLLTGGPAGTWSLVRVHPDGEACVIDAGEALGLARMTPEQEG